MMFVVTMMMFASCGGGAKKAETKQSEGTEIGLPVGLQLYTVRDDMAKDFKGTLQKVKELGYDGVEFAGFDVRFTVSGEVLKVKELVKLI